MLDGLVRDGKVRADSRATFGTVGISVVVRDGAARPDISSAATFKEAMLAARAVVHATPGQTPRRVEEYPPPAATPPINPQQPPQPRTKQP